VIATGSTVWRSHAGFVPWAFATDQQRRDRLGRTVIQTLIGSIRRECLDHVVILGERHLHDVLRSYAQYYNAARTHLSLAKDAPVSRAVQAIGTILPLPILGGLHHHYLRI
jgi:hypothetical protein